MRTKNSAYTAPKGKANGTKKAQLARPLQPLPVPPPQMIEDDDYEDEEVEEEEEEVEEEESEQDEGMLVYEDSAEDPDFDPADDEDSKPAKKRRGRQPAAAAKNNKRAAPPAINPTPNKRGRKPSAKVAANMAAAASAPASPSKVVLTPTPKKRGRGSKVTPINNAVAAVASPPIAINNSPGMVAAAAVASGTPTTTGVTNPAALTTPQPLIKNFPLKQLQSPMAGVSEARVKEGEAKTQFEIEKLTKHINMVIVNLRDEFASKMHAMKAEFDEEKKKIWETMGSFQVQKSKEA